jgi:hypothetical protein
MPSPNREDEENGIYRVFAAFRGPFSWNIDPGRKVSSLGASLLAQSCRYPLMRSVPHHLLGSI